MRAGLVISVDAHSEWVHSICGIGENHGSHCLAVETDSMRDIRHDLRERLASISGRYADEMAQYQEKREALDNAHRDTMTALDREKVAVEQLLAVEEERQGILPAAVEARKTARLVAL